MPFPSYIGKGTFTSGTAGLSVPLPTGRQTDDLLLLFVESANEAIATPSGWTAAHAQIGTGTAAAAGGVRIAVFYRVVDGTEAANVSVADSGNHTTAIVMLFRGVDVATPIHTSASSTQAATTSMSWPGVTTTLKQCLIVKACAQDTDAASTATSGTPTNSNLANLTERHDQTVATAAGGGIVVLTGEYLGTGSTGDTTSTGSTSVTHAYITLALNAASIDNFGDMAPSESGSDSMSASGAVSDTAVTGALDVTETGVDTASATGSVLVQGAVAAPEVGSDVAAASGGVLVQGSAAAVEAGSDTFAGAGPGGVISGTISATEASAGGSGQFGNRVDGSDTFPQSDNRVLVSSFTLTETATITAIGTRCTAGAGGGGNWWGVIYADNAGTPSTRLAVTAARTYPAGPAEVVGAVSPGVELAPGTYWVGSACNGVYDAPWDHQTGSGAMKRGEGFSPSGDWPGGGSDYTSTLTAWAEYEVAGGDEFASDGNVTAGGGATGTLAATESGVDALASTGGVLVQGAQSATESGADTLAAAGDVFVQGAVALSEAGADLLASSGGVIAQGSLAASEAGSDAFGSEGDVFASGSMAAVETGADTFAASGVDEQPAPVVVGGGSLSYEDAEAIYNRQTQRQALPDVDAQPQQKASTEAHGATEGPTGAPAGVVFADAFTAPARLPSLADVRAQIAEAQQAAMRAAAVSDAIQLQRIVQEAQAAEFAEEEAVAMLVLMMEAA